MDTCNDALVHGFVSFLSGSDDDDLVHILIVNVLTDGCNNDYRWKWETVQM